MLSDFKNRLTSLNEIIYFDDKQFLREKTNDAHKLQEYIDVVIDLLKSKLNDDEKYFVRGTLGNLYRIKGEPQNAINHLIVCLNYARDRQLISKEIASLIRLGEAEKYNDNHNKALYIFNLAFEKCQTNKIENYIDFVQQHKGKCLMEMLLLDDAEECLLEALRLRKRKGDVELINSTQKAIDLLSTIRRVK